MTGISLRIDGNRWRSHLRGLADSVPGLVPVAKGNGYGFGLELLAAETTQLGLDTIAVGTPAEAMKVREHFDGDIVVLLPWEVNDPYAVELARDPKVIVTVSRITDLETLGNLGGDKPRVLVEVLTSMYRHGLPLEDLPAVEAWADWLQFEGWTIHLPMSSNNRAEAERLGRAARAVAEVPLWFSHVSPDDYAALVAEFGEGNTRLRRGTELWLGQPAALHTTATVLDVHSLKRGQHVGYHQHPVLQDAWLLVVSGGTANGIGLEAPTAAKNMRQRMISLASGGLEAAGRALSPYSIGGKKRWFAEPPHMQSSLVLLPKGIEPPKVGDEIAVSVRNTIASFDNILIDDKPIG